MSSATNLLNLITTEAQNEGDLLVGTTRLEEESRSFDPEIKQSADKLSSAVSLAVPLNLGILRTITDHPTVIYKHHYQQINYLLDRASLRIARLVEREGYQALPIPASIYTSRSDFHAHLSHREIAYRAGLGWWGKCNLVIHPQFGAGIRLATILTSFEFPETEPLPDNCGSCRACADACPAHAIGKDISEFNRPACFAQLREFERKVIGVGICGICVRACREAREKTVKSER
jgi:epoxyqueuosine reductase QueG